MIEKCLKSKVDSQDWEELNSGFMKSSYAKIYLIKVSMTWVTAIS
jgi:hypothetical protein